MDMYNRFLRLCVFLFPSLYFKHIMKEEEEKNELNKSLLAAVSLFR